MGYNIFVSYKYADDSVQGLPGKACTTVRDYVNIIENKLGFTDHVYMGEHEDEDLSNLSEEEIWQRLRDKIFPTTITVVLISPNMKNEHAYDKSQWIPWEIRFSLIEPTRQDRTSHTNAVLAVVIPDCSGSYDYAIENNTCCTISCNLWKTSNLFTILQRNMFNQKHKKRIDCNIGDNVYSGYPSYIHMVRWCDFIDDMNKYFEISKTIQSNMEEYEIYKSVNKE